MQNFKDAVDHTYAGPLALYIHWPFCLKKCPYCDFNSHVRSAIDENAWQQALLAELSFFAEMHPCAKINSVFFGGGTPSLMPPAVVHALLNSIDTQWGLDADTEITLEANPSSVEAERFKAYRKAGVNRLSVGIQSLRDDALKFLGRLHSAREALEALKVARHTFDRVSFDLIYARPAMTVHTWQQELSQALAFDPDHLSLYQLTIEEGTAFYQQYQRGKFSLPGEEEAADLFALTQHMTATAGLPAYEVSNHARKGHESRHNLAYWTGLPYVGVGPGAHGRLIGKKGAAVAHAQVKKPEGWLSQVQKAGFATDYSDAISPQERLTEHIMMGLRLYEGVDLLAVHRSTGIDPKSQLDSQAITALQDSGYLYHTGTRLALTAQGMPLLNTILPKLFV